MNHQKSVEKVFKSPLTSVLEVQSEELFNYAQELDDFFRKEWYLLKEEIDDVNQNTLHFNSVLNEYKVDKCDRKLLVLKSTKEMLLGKISDFLVQERMIISDLRREEKRLNREIQNILRKYNIC